MKFEEYYALEWSVLQQCYHIQKVKEMLKDNENAAYGYETSDYIPIYFAETYEEVLKAAYTRFKSLSIKQEQNFNEVSNERI